MDSNTSNNVLAGLIPQTQASAPITPQPTHASMPHGATEAVAKSQAERVEDATSSLTPPPSAQVPSSNGHSKSHTPTPSGSHMSTPPPTVDALSQESSSRPIGAFARAMTSDQIAHASPDDLRIKVAELQAAYQAAKMSAAHHRLQYQMLAQESAAAIERMAVEARMVQCENEVIHDAEQAKANVLPAQPSPMQEGTIPVQKNLYQRMCRDIQHLSETNSFLETEHRQQEKLIFRQDNEIAGLSDKVLMMRDCIRERRDHQNRARSASLGRHLDGTPRSVYNTPRRPQATSHNQPQPFAALLQASAIASKEAGTRNPPTAKTPTKKGHTRAIHSLSSLPVTPNRSRKQQQPLFETPKAGTFQTRPMPSTAPVPRTSNIRTPPAYAQQALSLKRSHGPGSDGTVSASDHDDDNDNISEAETEILGSDQIDESRASFSATRMLRADPEPLSQQPEERSSFRPAKRGSGSLRQGKLFGAVRKSNVVRAGEDEPPAKRPRMLEGIGLGIEGVPR